MPISANATSARQDRASHAGVRLWRKQFADLLDHRYAEMQNLHMKVTIRHDGLSRIFVDSFMGPYTLDSSVFKEGDVAERKPLARFIMKPYPQYSRMSPVIMVQEYGNPVFLKGGTVSWESAFYEPQIPAGLKGPKFKNDFVCMYGTLMQTWCGPNAVFVQHIEHRIVDAKHIGYKKLNGVLCTVVQHFTSDGEREDVYWLDPSNLLVLWTTNDGGIKRERSYINEEVRGRISSENLASSVSSGNPGR